MFRYGFGPGEPAMRLVAASTEDDTEPPTIDCPAQLFLPAGTFGAYLRLETQNDFTTRKDFNHVRQTALVAHGEAYMLSAMSMLSANGRAVPQSSKDAERSTIGDVVASDNWQLKGALRITRSDGLSLSRAFPVDQRINLTFRVTDIAANVAFCTSELST